MSEDLMMLIAFFFDEVGANRIESRYDPGNPHSGMVMKKCGIKYEGTLRSSDRNNRAYVMPIDMVCFDLTDNRALERFQSIDDDELKWMEK